MAEVSNRKIRAAHRRRLIVNVAILSVMWLLLSGHYDAFHLALGVLSIVVVLLLNRKLEPYTEREVAHPVKPLRLLGYVPWLFAEMILAALHVAAVVLSPRMPLAPSLVRFRSNQPNDLAKVILGNSITITPGTLTIELQDDEFLVHALTRDTAEGLVSGRMQRKVARLFVDEPDAMIFDVEQTLPTA